MKTLLIVYHSLTTGTEQLCQAIFDGAKASEEPLRVRMLKASEAAPADLLSADGYVFAAPENLAAIAGVMKDFFDRSYYPALGQLNGRPVCIIVCAGTDGRSACAQMQRICTGWRLKEVMPAKIVCTHADSEEAIMATKVIDQRELDACFEIGQGMATGLSLGVF